MREVIAAQIVCPQCGREVAIDAATCGHCGAATGIQPAAAGRASSRPIRPWYDNRVVVLCLMWAMMGPFALPILWYSRAFSLRSKLVQTVLMACLTAFITWGLWYSWTVTLPMVRDLIRRW